MKKGLIKLAILAIVVTALACSDTTHTTAPEPANSAAMDVAGGGDFAELEGGRTTVAAVIDAGSGEVVGTSKLVRTDGEIRAKLLAGDLYDDHAFTTWWVVFNDPSACSDGECGENDLFSPDVMADILYVDGDVSDQNGEAIFRGRLAVGDTTGTIAPLFGMTPHGLLDTDAAEVHLIVRSHGPVVPGLKYAQLSSYGGGCDTEVFPPQVPDQIGECGDIQFAVHQP